MKALLPNVHTPKETPAEYRADGRDLHLPVAAPRREPRSYRTSVVNKHHDRPNQCVANKDKRAGRIVVRNCGRLPRWQSLRTVPDPSWRVAA